MQTVVDDTVQVAVRVGGQGLGARSDVVIEADARHTVGELATALERHGVGPVPALWLRRQRRQLDPAEPVVAVGLRCGDELEIGTVAPARKARSESRAVLDVTGGPCTGETFELTAGQATLGRSVDCEVVVDDQTLSRRAVVFTVDAAHAPGAVTVEPHPAATTPLTVRGRRVTRVTQVGDGDEIVVAATRMVLRRPADLGPAEPSDLDRFGRLRFLRTPYRPAVVADRSIQVAQPPTPHANRRLQLISAIAPLAAGLTMYAFSRQVQFLALTLVSPVAMLATAIDDRRSGRRRHAAELREYRAGVRALLADVAVAIEAERRERLQAAPDLAELMRRVRRRATSLWERGRGASDFLCLRVGVGSAASRVVVEEAPGSADPGPEVADLRRSAARVDDVPIVLDLRRGVLAVHGSRPELDRWWHAALVQAVCLHSPDDLVIACAIDDETHDWLKWLPHVRGDSSPLVRRLATTPAEADAMVTELLALASERLAAAAVASRAVPVWPAILFLLDERFGVDPAQLSALLDVAPSTGVSVLWLGPDAAAVPRQAVHVLELRASAERRLLASLWSSDPAVETDPFEAEQLRAPLAERLAMSLASIGDAVASGGPASIPSLVPLAAVVAGSAGVGRIDRAAIVDNWSRPRSTRLDATIGVGVDGPVEVDLVADGPHALIAGTSGSGKSELLQSLVASLASRHSPSHLNFLFVDYKGGASSKVFEGLPHTVGYVTNLDADLAGRALVSLRAELNHRMALLEGRAKDLHEMSVVAPDEAPASLVIVVDEFATLVKEVPEFVAGIVDIAQRGRSLGIHLVLATQRPAGVVNDNILANINLRICLRVLERAESTSLIGIPDAADIPAARRGRAFVRLGPRRVVEFQSAYSGAAVAASASRPPLRLSAFDGAARPPAVDETTDAAGATQLRALLDAAADVARELRLPPTRRPWRDELPAVVPIEDVCAEAGVSPSDVGRLVPLGLADEPDRQDQRPLVADLAYGGGLLVFGAGGSGRTTLLRSIAASSLHAGEAEVIAFDNASRGLEPLRELPGVVDVAAGDDLEAVTRHLVTLERELDQRRIAAHDRAPSPRGGIDNRSGDRPPIVVLIDGIGSLLESFERSSHHAFGGDAWVERVIRIAIEGRQVGIHFVIGAERRSAVPARLHGAIGQRLVLRHADEGGYHDHGVALSQTGQLATPGRALWQGRVVVQLACVGDDPSEPGQRAALARLAQQLPPRRRSSLATAVLGDRLTERPVVVERVGDANRLAAVPVGIIDVTGQTAMLDLTWSHAVCCGPGRSGRSTLLANVATALGATADVYAVGPASSELHRLAIRRAAFGRAEQIAPVLERVLNLVAMGRPTRPIVVLIDDLDRLEDPELTQLWERLAAAEHVRIVVAVESRSMSGFTMNPLLNLLRRTRQLIVLQPEEAAEFQQLSGVRFPGRPGLAFPPGRAVLVANRTPTIFQAFDALASI